jgi:cell division protein FtsW (lipid II flippase)
MAVGLVLFAAIMMFLVGLFQAFTGLVAIFNDEYYLATQDYLLKFDQTTWGWVHLILGLVAAAAGVGLMSGRTWARAVAIVLALISAIVTFGFIPYYPLWPLIIIALDVAVVWAVAAYGREAFER